MPTPSVSPPDIVRSVAALAATKETRTPDVALSVVAAVTIVLQTVPALTYSALTLASTPVPAVKLVLLVPPAYHKTILPCAVVHLASKAILTLELAADLNLNLNVGRMETVPQHWRAWEVDVENLARSCPRVTRLRAALWCQTLSR